MAVSGEAISSFIDIADLVGVDGGAKGALETSGAAAAVSGFARRLLKLMALRIVST
jgi:hypothetical protein